MSVFFAFLNIRSWTHQLKHGSNSCTTSYHAHLFCLGRCSFNRKYSNRNEPCTTYVKKILQTFSTFTCLGAAFLSSFNSKAPLPSYIRSPPGPLTSIVSPTEIWLVNSPLRLSSSIYTCYCVVCLGEMFCFIEIKKSAYWRGTQGAASFFHHQEIWDEHLRDKPANSSWTSLRRTLNQNWP